MILPRRRLSTRNLTSGKEVRSGGLKPAQARTLKAIYELRASLSDLYAAASRDNSSSLLRVP
ncbi:hypothetical protein CS542_07385 [Pedobacter sp. IW39]|nr:hypothetical protein CS542_07385 [Pedobacter sp. IW39]